LINGIIDLPSVAKNHFRAYTLEQYKSIVMYLKKVTLTLLSIVSFYSIQSQHVGINVDAPTAQLHIEHIRDTTTFTTINFEDQTNPIPTFSSWTITNGDAPEGDFYLSSLPWDFAEAMEWNLTDSVPQGQKLYISYYMRYDLDISDQVIVGPRFVEGPATSGWQKYTDTLYSSNSFSVSSLMLSGNPLSHFDLDSITIFQDPNEGKTLRINDGYQQEGWILTTDHNGYAKWSHGGQTTAMQFLYYDQNKLAMHPPGNSIDIKQLSREDAVLELKSNKSLWWKRNGLNSTGTYSINLSELGTSTGSHSANFGKSTHAPGSYALSYGQTVTAEGDHSFAGGTNTLAKSYAEIALGQFGKLQSSPSQDTWSNNDYLMVLGNGTSSGNTSNALTVLKNGEVGIGDIVPNDHQLAIKHGYNEGLQIMLDSTGSYWHYSVANNGDLLMGQNGTYIFIYDAAAGAFYNYSDPRLKNDMVPLSSALTAITTLPLYSYSYKGQKSPTVGVSAEQLANTYPDLIRKQKRDDGEEEFLAVNYQGLNIYAIKALQELSEKHNKLELKVQELENQMKSLLDKLE